MRTLETFDMQDGDEFVTGWVHSRLAKANEEDGKWIVYLEASNESKDQDGEITVMKALQEDVANYLKQGVISWDHQHRIKNDPKYIIGEPVDVAFTSTHSTLIKGILYKENEIAQGVWNNLLSNTTRFGASVGGWILKKSEGTIKKVAWRDTAITDKPVNADTLGNVQTIPFSEFAKSLQAGSGVNAGAFEGGRAITPESLQGADVEITPYLVSNAFYTFLKGVREDRVKSFDQARAMIKSQILDDKATDQVMNFILKKVQMVNTK